MAVKPLTVGHYSCLRGRGEEGGSPAQQMSELMMNSSLFISEGERERGSEVRVARGWSRL